MTKEELKNNFRISPYRNSLKKLYSSITGNNGKTSYEDMLSNNREFASFCTLFFSKSIHFDDTYLCLCEPEFQNLWVPCPNNKSAKYKILLAVEYLAILMDGNKLKSSYSKKLKELRPLLTDMAFIRSTRYSYILFPQKLVNLFTPSVIGGRKNCYYLKTDINFITDSIMGFVDDSDTDSVSTRPIMAECLTGILYDAGVRKEKDITPEKYLDIAKNVLSSFGDSGTLRINTVLGSLNAYIKYCIRNYSCIEKSFYESSFFSVKILTDGKINKFIKNGYVFMALENEAVIKAPERVVFLRRNLDRFSTKTWPNDFFSLDLSGLEIVYRKAILSWALTNRTTIRLPENLSYIAKTLRKLSTLKSENGNSIESITREELTEIAYDSDKNRSEFSDGIYIIRNFFSYAESKNLLSVENGAMLILSPQKKKKGLGGHVAEKNWINDVNGILQEKALSDTSYYELVHYVAFRLSLVVPLRISQILSLRIGNIVRRSNGKCVIIDESKTSKGNSTVYALTDGIARLIFLLIEKTGKIREKCTNCNTADFIFIYWSHSYSEVKVATKVTFRKYLERPELGNEKGEYLSARLLRCTVLTGLRMWCEENHVSPHITNIITCHSDSKVIFENYYDYTNAGNGDIGYEITGDFEKSITMDPEEFKSELIKEAFNPEDCDFRKKGFQCPFTCLICEHFVATKDHLPYFRERLHITEKRIESASDSRQKEELELFKKLYSLYINLLEED